MMSLGVIRISTATDIKNDNAVFVDRESQRQIFRENLGAVPKYGSHLIYYAGTGGVGKTALIQELKNSIQENSTINSKIKFVSYDFTSGLEMFKTLNAMKKFLSDNYNVEFKFFEKGCLSYYKKCGDNAGKEQIEKIFQESTYLNRHKRKLNTAIQQSYNISNVNRVLGDSIDIAKYIAEGIPIFRIIECAIELLDKGITKLENSNLEYEGYYRNFLKELGDREAHISPEAIKEYLPTLFAMDISNWLKKKRLYLVIFLDTYEQLTEDEKDTKPHEKLIYEGHDVPVDWWIEHLICNTLNRVLWVVAGRSKIEKIGKNIEVNENEHLFNLMALEEKFANEFLIRSGIEDKNLRKGLIKLTGSYPIFLSLCVDTYNSAISNNSKAPELDEFGKEREDVIKRLLEFMDDGTRNMVKRLCILGKWTDFYAKRVLSNLHENNSDTYKRVIKLSFVTKNSENILVFDRSICEILFVHLIKNEPIFVTETIKAVNNFFASAFHKVNDDENKTITHEDRVLFFKLWAEFILSTCNNADDWQKQYDAKLLPISANFDNALVEGVILQFKNKIEKIFKKENLPYAYFEYLLAQIKFAEGNDRYATELAKNAYEKIAAESNIANLKNYMTAGHYAMALFYAMGSNRDADKYESFSTNFKLSIKLMKKSEKEIMLSHYSYLLKCFLDLYRNCDEVISMIDNTMEFIGNDEDCLGKCLNEFVIILQMYKLGAVNHLGQVEKFHEIVEKDYLLTNSAEVNIGLQMDYINRAVVHLQDTFDYTESLKRAKKGIDLFDDTDKTLEVYKYSYCCLCGSLVLTYYFMLNNSNENLEFARNYSDIAMNGFISPYDKMRQYQLRAQIEAEVGNFDEACTMLDKGIAF